MRTSHADWTHDHSTINMELLHKLCKQFDCPPQYYIEHGGEGGNGCYGDPPGYPTYFTRCVYTQHGNSPTRSGIPDMTLFRRALPDYEAAKAIFEKIYTPLPIDHPRVRQWILNHYRHFNGCYHAPGYDQEKPNDSMFIPSLTHMHLLNPRQTKGFGERMTDAEYLEERIRVDELNWGTVLRLKPLITPEAHKVVHIVRRWYPDYQPELDLIETAPTTVTTWWERYDHAPLPGEFCPGDRSIRQSHTDAWCQFCGART